MKKYDCQNWIVLIPILQFPIQRYHTNNNAIFLKCNCKCPKMSNFLFSVLWLFDIFIASNYCCLRLLLPQLSVSPVGVLPVAAQHLVSSRQFAVSSSVGKAGQKGRGSFAKAGQGGRGSFARGAFHIVPFLIFGLICFYRNQVYRGPIYMGLVQCPARVDIESSRSEKKI